MFSLPEFVAEVQEVIRPVLEAFFKVSMHKFIKAYRHIYTIFCVWVKMGEAERRVWVSHLFGPQLRVSGATSPRLALNPSEVGHSGESICLDNITYGC